MGKYGEAMGGYERALGCDGGWSPAVVGMSRLGLGKGKVDLVIEWCQGSVKGGSADWETYGLCAEAFDRKNKYGYDGTLLILNDGILKFPENGKLDRQKAVFLEKIKRKEEAIASFLDAAQKFRDFTHEYLSSIECYKFALKLDPKNAPAMNGLARVLLKNKNVPEA
jgi:tetratricopeptide (TPR) repeat protein